MSITPQVLETHFLPMNQQAPNSLAPVGRVAKMENSIARQFENGNLKIGQRGAFRQLTKKVIDLDPNAPSHVITESAGLPHPPDLMSSLENELVIVTDNHIYALAEDSPTWSRFTSIITTVIPRQKNVYTSNVTMKDLDSASIGGVVCYTWKQHNDAAQSTEAWFMVVDSDGSPIVEPRSLGATADNNTWTGGETNVLGQVGIKVIQDGTRFWIFQSYGLTAIVATCDVDGTLLGSPPFATLAILDNEGPSWWDIQFGAFGVKWYGSTDTVSQALYTFVESSGTITSTLHSYVSSGFPDATRPFWLSNPLDGSSAYLGIVTDSTPSVSVHKISNSGTVLRSVTLQTGFVFNEQCEATGYVDIDGTIHTLLSKLDVSPVFNLTTRSNITTGDVLTSDSPMNSVTVASRAFRLDGRFVCIMYFTDGVQPTYFLHDLETAQPIGMWSHGSTSQDWQASDDLTFQFRNYDAWHVPSSYIDNDGSVHCAVSFIAETVARNFKTFTVQGNDPIRQLDNTRFVSCIGLADMKWSTDGTATEYADELFIPGPHAVSLTGIKASENNFDLFPSPVSFDQSHSDAGNLDLDSQYSIVVVFECTDARGNRTKSRPSDPQLFTLTGTNNIATIGGATLFETYGKTNVVISIYSTFNVAGVISTDHRKITDDLRPLLNDKTSLTWSFTFNKTSAEIQVGEPLYTDQGLLPHDPCPGHSTGCVAGARVFVAAWDGAIWYSDEKVEGQPLVFNQDVRRVLPPTSDEIKVMRALDSGRVIIFCEKSIWEFDVTQLPGPDGLNGNVKAPTRFGFNNGGKGRAEVCKDGIYYDSSAGGVWLISRALENVQIFAPAYSEFLNRDILAITTDKDQRTVFALNQATDGFVSIVRDQLNFAWSTYLHNTKVYLVHSLRGKLVCADIDSVHIQDETLDADTLIDGTKVPIVQDVITAPIQFGNVKGMKCLWRFLVSGTFKDDHQILIDATYATEDGDVSESWIMVPDPTAQYEFDFQPMVQELTSITLRFRSGFSGVSPVGDSFELETISFEVGIDNHLTRTPPTPRRGQSS